MGFSNSRTFLVAPLAKKLTLDTLTTARDFRGSSQKPPSAIRPVRFRSWIRLFVVNGRTKFRISTTQLPVDPETSSTLGGSFSTPEETRARGGLTVSSGSPIGCRLEAGSGSAPGPGFSSGSSSSGAGVGSVSEFSFVATGSSGSPIGCGSGSGLGSGQSSLRTLPGSSETGSTSGVFLVPFGAR